jgi:small subunit ribosomal protein S2e
MNRPKKGVDKTGETLQGRFKNLRLKNENRKPNLSKEWVPITKLGRLVKNKKIKSIEQVFYHSISIKEQEIIDYFLGSKLKDEVIKILPVQKQTRAGQRTRFKAFVIIGDLDGHVGLGIKTAKEAAAAIRGAIVVSKLSLIPARRGFWGETEGKSHTVPIKVTGKCGSIRLRCIPAPRGTGIVAGKTPKKLLIMAGYQDVFTSSKGRTRTIGNFAKATFMAISLTYNFVTPDFWPEQKIISNPLF